MYFSTAELQNELKDQLISGTRLRTVRYELLKSPDLEWEQSVQLAKTAELADAKAESLLSPQTRKQEATKAPSVNATWHVNKGPQQRGYNSLSQRGRGASGFGQGRGTTRGRGSIQQRAPASNTPAASTPATEECYCCGGKGHRSYQCSLRNKYCSECGKQGRIYKTCARNRNRPPAANQNLIDSEQVTVDETSNEEQRFTSDHCPEVEDGMGIYMYMMKEEAATGEIGQAVAPHIKTIKVNGELLEMEVDSGAPISAVSVEIYKKKISSVGLNTPKRELRGYDKKPIATVGYIDVKIERNYVK